MQACFFGVCFMACILHLIILLAAISLAATSARA
jgi:hypothetical protein